MTFLKTRDSGAKAGVDRGQLLWILPIQAPDIVACFSNSELRISQQASPMPPVYADGQ